MPEREALLEDFLDGAGRASWLRTPLAGDASARRYERLRDPASGRTEVLMDAHPDMGEDLRRFVEIAAFLRSLGLSAPELLAANEGAGFLLLEDLGDDLFASVAPRNHELESGLYDAAADALAVVSRADPPEGLRAYDPDLMASAAALSYDWYAFGVAGRVPDARDRFAEELKAELAFCSAGRRTTILRDYHAENLLWLPDRKGAARVGLLDFQDAMLGHPAYDVMSLLTDARRDVPREIADRTAKRFARIAGLETEEFERAYALLGTQRNLRILGVFARLSLRFGKPRYVDFIPRVWGHLEAGLRHPALTSLARRILSDLPPPDSAALHRLKAKCATATAPTP